MTTTLDGSGPDPGLLRRVGLATAGACALVLLALLVGDRVFPAGEPTSASDLVWLLSLLSYPVVGTVILARNPRHRIGWVYLAVGVLLTFGLMLGAVADTLSAGGSAAAPTIAQLANLPFGALWALVTTVAILWFPDGRLPSRRWRAVAWLAGASVVADASIALFPAIETPVIAATAGVSLLCLASVVARWRSGDADDRRRLSWLLLAVLVILLAVAAGLVNSLLGGPYPIGVLAEATVQAAIPVATGVAILRSGLFDIEVVIDRTVVYVALTALVLGSYALVVTVSTKALGESAGQASALLAAVAVAVTTGALTTRLVAGVDRLLYGERSSPYTVLSHVARETTGSDDVDDLLEAAARTVARDLRVPFVDIVPEPSAGSHDETRPCVVVDLTHRGRREGILVVGLRRGQRRFSGRESALLDDLARQLAVTIRAVRLSGELEHSRERIVRAREAERLRIRRDLHDGLGPVLAAAGLQADTLRDHLDPDDAAAHALLDRMGVGLRQGVGDIRRTVEGLRPPALDQIGLAAVVAEHAAALDSPRLSVATELDELAPGAVPAAVEVAAYRIAVEALTNVARHSGARRCTVRLARERETLVVEVVDDGRGLATDVHLGVGLTSMRERAEELGGSLLVTAPAAGVDGTLVRAVLPVHGGT